MKKDAVTLDQLAREIAAEMGLPILKTKKILLLTLDEITKELKDKERVRLNGFGTLRKTIRKSRRIVQVQTKNPRLLLEQESIRFIPTPELKATLAGRAYVPDRHWERQKSPKVRKLAPSGVEGSESNTAVSSSTGRRQDQGSRIIDSRGRSSSLSDEVQTSGSNDRNDNNKSVNDKKLNRINLTPLPSFIGRVDAEKVRLKIRERLIGLAKQQTAKPVAKRGLSPAAKIFVTLFKKIQKENLNSLNFSLENSEKVYVFTIRPRQKIATVNRNVVSSFLQEYFEIETVHLPQVRFARIDFTSKIKLVEFHSIPTSGGMSVVMRVK